MKWDENALLHYECNSLRLNIVWQLCVNGESDHHVSSSVLWACRASDEVSGQTLLMLIVKHAVRK